MRLLIGYDGSECSDAAVDELGRAGLPQDAEAEVMTVGDIPPAVAAVESTGVCLDTGMREYIRQERDQVRIDAEWTADKAAARLRNHFAGWKVDTNAALGRPHVELLNRAEAWPADLLVLGSHGRGPLGRLVFGSIALYATHHCRRSLRIGRPAVTNNQLPHLMLATDGSPAAAEACRAIAARNWPAGTRVRVLSVCERGWIPMGTSEASELVPPDPELVTKLRLASQRIAEEAAEQLRTAGLAATPVSRDGRARYDIVAEAEREKIDCIFLGAVGHGAVERLLIGSVAAAVAARAACSVEVVRG